MKNISAKNSAPKPFVFVLMPFSSGFIYIYEHGIKKAAEAAGAYCEKVDEQDYVGGIAERILNQISRADVIVGDTTGSNPNVTYEIGYAHALDKPVILISQNVEKLSFDIQHLNHLKYTSSGDLFEPLKTRVEHLLSESESRPYESSALEYSIEGVVLPAEGVDIPLSGQNRSPNLEFSIDITNRENLIIDLYETQFWVRFDSSDIDSVDGETVKTQVPDGKKGLLTRLDCITRIFPRSWASLSVRATTKLGLDSSIAGVLIVSTHWERQELEFTIRTIGASVYESKGLAVV